MSARSSIARSGTNLGLVVVVSLEFYDFAPEGAGVLKVVCVVVTATSSVGGVSTTLVVVKVASSKYL